MKALRNKVIRESKKQSTALEPCDKRYKMYIKSGNATMLFASNLTYVQYAIMKCQMLQLATKFNAKIEVQILKPMH